MSSKFRIEVKPAEAALGHSNPVFIIELKMVGLVQATESFVDMSPPEYRGLANANLELERFGKAVRMRKYIIILKKSVVLSDKNSVSVYNIDIRSFLEYPSDRC
jgi:hypothetical protein